MPAVDEEDVLSVLPVGLDDLRLRVCCDVVLFSTRELFTIRDDIAVFDSMGGHCPNYQSRIRRRSLHCVLQDGFY